jgi:hypothetical protein
MGNIINGGDEEYPLKRDSRRAFDRVFVKHINNGIVTSKTNFPSSPDFVTRDHNPLCRTD